jgi:hypothetical protein
MRIKGVVIKKETDSTIARVRIGILGQDDSILTDSYGRFSISARGSDSIALVAEANEYARALIDCDGFPQDGFLTIELPPAGPWFGPDGVHLPWFHAAWYRDAFRQGRERAGKDIAERQVAIPQSTAYSLPMFDDSTGFPLYEIAGCVVNDSIFGYSYGYKSRLREWLRSNGIPRWSRKPWLGQVRSAAELFASMSATAVPTRLDPNDDSVFVSPDGKWTILVAPPEAGTRVRLTIVDSVGSTKSPDPLWGGDVSFVDLCWGPIGSDVVAIRRRDIRLNHERSDTTSLEVMLDLRTARYGGWDDRSRF